MRYITGIHALNLPCSLGTCGDWHTSALRWEDITFRNSGSSILGDYGIELGKTIPEHTGTYAVANHIRALLDLIIEGNFSVAQGMRDDFICDASYTPEILEAIKFILSKTPDKEKRQAIDRFMGKEYMMEWYWFKQKEGLNFG